MQEETDALGSHYIPEERSPGAIIGKLCDSDLTLIIRHDAVMQFMQFMQKLRAKFGP